MSDRRTARLSSKYQISIPKAVRDKVGWQPGQELAFVPDGAGLVLVPVPSRADLRGSMKGADTSDIRDHTDRS